MRFIELDVHRDFRQVAIATRTGSGRRDGGTTPGPLRLFAERLAADDQVALEASGNALAITVNLRPPVGRAALEAGGGGAG